MAMLRQAAFALALSGCPPCPFHFHDGTLQCSTKAKLQLLWSVRAVPLCRGRTALLAVEHPPSRRASDGPWHECVSRVSTVERTPIKPLVRLCSHTAAQAQDLPPARIHALPPPKKANV